MQKPARLTQPRGCGTSAIIPFVQRRIQVEYSIMPGHGSYEEMERYRDSRSPSAIHGTKGIPQSGIRSREHRSRSRERRKHHDRKRDRSDSRSSYQMRDHSMSPYRESRMEKRNGSYSRSPKRRRRRDSFSRSPMEEPRGKHHRPRRRRYSSSISPPPRERRSRGDRRHRHRDSFSSSPPRRKRSYSRSREKHKSSHRRPRSPSPSRSPPPSKRSTRPLPSQEAAYTSNAEPTSVDLAPAPEKQKPNYAPTGLLAAETNTVANTSIVLKYHEPPDSRLPPPSSPYLLYIFKSSNLLSELPLHERSCWLFGREKMVADVAIEHPSCSKQHAVLQFRYVVKKDEWGEKKGGVGLYVLDLDSANGTWLNGERVEERRYVEVRGGDVLRWGQSEREYVVLQPPR